MLAGLAGTAARAQAPTGDVHPDFLVKHFTVADGLPVNQINDLAQTRDGYLWMATFDGLARFDGHRFTVFNTSTHSGLPGNRLYEVHEDAEGALWILTEAGEVARFVEGRFTPFPPPEDLPGHAQGFYQDADTLWIRTLDGLLRYRNGTLQHFRPDLIQGDVGTMHRDRRGALWIDAGATLIRLDPDGAVQRYGADEGWEGAYQLFEDACGTLWALAARGLMRLREDRLERVAPAAGAPYTTTGQDAGGVRWFGNELGWWRLRDGRLEPFAAAAPGPAGRGLIQNPAGHTWRVQFPWIYRDTTPVLRLDVFSSNEGGPEMLVDREGNLWYGNDGLYRITPRLLRAISVPEGLPERNVYPILEARDGAIWVGLWGATGLARLRGETLTAFDLERGNPDGQSPANMVTALHEDRTGALWVGTLEATCRLQRARCVPVAAPIPEAFLDRVSAIHEDRRGRLWLGSDAGLAVRTPGPDGQRWTTYPLPHSVRALVETADGTLLAGTLGGGLGRLLDGGRHEWLTTADGLASDHVRDVYEDRDGILWIATQDRGLCRLDRQGRAALRTGALVCLDTDDGLFDNSLHRILEDAYGRFWMSTNRGIFWVERAELNAFAAGAATAVTSVSYTERDGMRNREANGARQPAGIKASDGRLWFPTQDGVVIIDPSQVQRPEAPPVVIETATIGDRTERTNGALTLAAGERDLDIGYTALAFARPEDVRFQVRLDGYDETWQDMADRRTASYTNLPAGRYTFRVKAGLGGAWTEEAATLTITRQPFFWETGWFYGLVAVFFAFAGPSLYVFRVRRLKARQETLERLVAARTEQIRAQAAQLEAQAAELQHTSALKSRFLANISHEFRTPLTLTFGPLNDLLAGRYATLDEARPQLERATRNGQRLLRLINQLLELSRLDAGQLRLRPQAHDLVAFLRQRVAAFESLAQTRRLTLRFRPEAETLPYVFDAEKLETVVLNLLSNAFKFTPEGGTVEVAVQEEIDGAVGLTVRDTGVGTAPEHLPRLFDRFYQVDSSTTRPREGTGIGLALVRQLVELHGGAIDVESTVGAGTTFTVRLPACPLADAAPSGTAPPAPAAPPPEPAHTAVLADLDAFARSPNTAPAHAAANGAAPDDEATVVLIVDDNADLRAYIRSHLDDRYHVEEAEDGAAGLRRAVDLVPDLVLSDVMMPRMDGFALLAALKADPSTSHVPVVLLTAKADAESRLAGLHTGADDYLEKPFDAEELRARVANLIESRRHLRALWSKSLLTPEAVEVPSVEAAFLEAVKAAIEQGMGDAGFGVDDLAAAVGMSPRQLQRKLRGLLGETPGALVQRFRLERAAMLLRQQAGSVKEIAFAVGYRSTSQFRKAFQQAYGTAPSAYAATR